MGGGVGWDDGMCVCVNGGGGESAYDGHEMRADRKVHESELELDEHKIGDAEYDREARDEVADGRAVVRKPELVQRLRGDDVGRPRLRVLDRLLALLLVDSCALLLCLLRLRLTPHLHQPKRRDAVHLRLAPPRVRAAAFCGVGRGGRRISPAEERRRRLRERRRLPLRLRKEEDLLLEDSINPLALFR